MNRKEILEAAEKCICTDRNEQYGEPENSFEAIANLWDAYIHSKPSTKITAKDAANMLALFKIARTLTAITHKDDSYIDAVGYMACAGELSAREHKAKVDNDIRQVCNDIRQV